MASKDSHKNDTTSTQAEEKTRNKNLLTRIIREKDFKLIRILDFGKFNSMAVKFPKIRREIAVQILKPDEMSEGKEAWKDFHHCNIMPLLATEYLKNLDVYLFYTLTMECSLKEKTENIFFRKSVGAMTRLVSYFTQISRGLSYLHSNDYAHLNIRQENILITSYDVAKITDFYWLRYSYTYTNLCGLPAKLRGPESFYRDGRGTMDVNTKNADIWAFAMMMIDALTGSYLESHLPDMSYWKKWSKEIYPVIYEVLKKEKFNKLVMKRYSKTSKTVDLKSIRYLIAYTMAFYPMNRPSANDLCHLFMMLQLHQSFPKRTEMKLEKDFIWKEKRTLSFLVIFIFRRTGEVGDERLKRNDEFAFFSNG